MQDLQNFRTYLQKRKSQNTIIAYITAVSEFLEKAPKLEPVKEEDIDNYFDRLNSNGFAYKTKLLRLAALKKYLKFKNLPELSNYIDDCLEDGVIKEIESQSKFNLDEKKIEILCKKIKSEDIRDRLIIDLLLDTGIRISELLNLARSNIDFEHLIINIYQQKQGTWRKVEMTEAIEKSLKAYLQQYKIKDKLFDLTRQAVDMNLKHILKRAGLPKQSAHMFRHYRLTRWAKEMPIQYVQVLSGHKNLSSLMKYTHLSFEDVIKFKNNKDRIRDKFRL